MPKEYFAYREISKQFRQLPLCGSSEGCQLVNRPDYFFLEDSMPTQDSETFREGFYQKMTIGAFTNCSCCFIGVRYSASKNCWRMIDIEDRRIKKEESDLDPGVFLVDWGLRHFSNNWQLENEPGEFSTIRSESREIWGEGRSVYWYHDSGILGRSVPGTRFDFDTMKMKYLEIEYSMITFQSRSKAESVVGRDL